MKARFARILQGRD